MKKLGIINFLFFITLTITAQTTTHYSVVKSELDAQASIDILNQLEANWPLYQAWLGNKAFTPATLKINIYRNNASFNDALAPQKLPGRRNDFIYLYYNNPDKNILYVYPMDSLVAGKNMGSDHTLSKKAMSEALNRHGFLQYLFAVAPTAPAWFREGSALYFEAINQPLDGSTPIVSTNRDYLANLKEWNGKDAIAIDQLLSLTDEQFIENAERNLVFSWGLVNFLVATNRSSLLNSIAQAIDGSATQQVNSNAVKALIVAQNLQAPFNDYIINTKTFTELITLGSQAYADGNYNLAKTFFMEATLARGDLYAAHYYLGLIAYSTGNYDDAKAYYAKALANGAPDALINYNLGFVAFKEGDYDLTVELLTRAKSEDYPKYGVGADKLLKVVPTELAIEALKPSPSSANASAVTAISNESEKTTSFEQPVLVNP